MNYKRQRLIFLILYLAYTSIYVARVNLSVAGPEMIEANLMSTVQLGALGSAFSTIYAVGRLINGGMSDRKPPWLMLTTGLAIAGLSNMLVGFFPPFIGIFLLWAANAYAQSMLWSSVLCVLAAVYDEKEAKKKSSLMVTSVATGNIVSIILNTFLITRLGTRFAFVVPGMLTAILGACVFFATRNVEVPEVPAKKHIPMLALLKDKKLSAMLVPALFHGVMKENISLWMAVYVVDKYKVDLTTSAYYILLIPIIGFIGRTAYPLLYKLCRDNEDNASLVGFVLCVLSSLLLCTDVIAMPAAVLCLSVIYASVSMINTSLLTMLPMHYTRTGNVASVSGIMDFATYLGGGLASLIYGALIKSFGYLPMFVSWVIISVVSISVIIYINKVIRKEENNYETVD